MADPAHENFHLRSALIGGVMTAIIAFGGLATVGRISPFRAIALLEAIVPTIRFLSSATLTGGITMLALMLTLLSFTATHTEDFTDIHYDRIRQISTVDALLIILSMILLMVLLVTPLITFGFPNAGALAMEPLGAVAGTASAGFWAIQVVGGVGLGWAGGVGGGGRGTPRRCGLTP